MVCFRLQGGDRAGMTGARGFRGRLRQVSFFCLANFRLVSVVVSQQQCVPGFFETYMCALQVSRVYVRHLNSRPTWWDKQVCENRSWLVCSSLVWRSNRRGAESCWGPCLSVPTRVARRWETCC